MAPKIPPKPDDGKEYTYDKASNKWITKEDLASKLSTPTDNNFAFALQAIDNNHDLSTVFQQAWDAESSDAPWSAEKFKTEVMKTDWYNLHSSNWRAYYLKSNDPLQAGNFEKDIYDRSSRINEIARNFGATLSEQQVADLAKNTLQNGTSDADIQGAVSKYIQYSTLTEDGLNKVVQPHLTGGAGQTETSIREWARQYGVTVSDNFVKAQTQSVMQGGNANDAKNYIVDLAKKTYSPWADSITSTQSTLDAGAHYRNSISNMLGTPIESIDMNNKWMKSFMSNKTDKGEVLTLQDAEKSIRHSDEWAISVPGREEINRSTNQILSKMGLA